MDTLRLLGQALECSVCLEQLDASSRVLPCQHTFCQKCCLDIINTHKELRCPECRVLVTVPFKSLPPNILLMRILEGIKKIPPDSETSSFGNLIELPSPDQQSQAGNDPFSFLSQVTAITTTTTTESGMSGSGMNPVAGIHLGISQSALQSNFNNPFLSSHTEASTTSNVLRGFPISSSQNGSVPPFQVSSSNFTTQSNGCSSESVIQSISSSNSFSHHMGGIGHVVDSLSSLNRNPPVSDTCPTNTASSFFHTSMSPFSAQQPHSSAPPSATTSVQPMYTLAGTSSLTQTSMSVLSTLSDSSSNPSSLVVGSSNAMHIEWPYSTSLSQSESQPVTSSPWSESQTGNTRPSASRQISAKSVKESHTSEVNPHTFIPPLNIQAKALYNYDGKEARDLKFKKGDVVTICKQIDENWYMGELDGNFGIVPTSYVKLQDSSSSNIPQCKALYDFKMASEEERSCLMFTKGETITVLRRIDDNWAEGKLNSHIGIFPLSFVELNDAAKTLIRLSGSVAPNSLHLSTTTPITILPPTASTITTVTTTTSLAAPYLPTHTIPQTAQPALSTAKQENEPQPSTERHSFSDSQPSTRSTPFPSNPSASVSPSATRISSGSCIATSNSQKSSGPSNQMKRTATATPHTPSDADTSPPRSTTLLTTESHQLYIALYSYRPRKADELELKKGQLYSVADKCQDGWFKGRCLTSDKIGVFPGNYVQLADSQTVTALFFRSPRDASSTPSCHVTWTALKNSPAYSYITYGRPKFASFVNQLPAAPSGDGWNATNGSAVPPELPPRAATSSGKSLVVSSQFQNSCVERSVSESFACRSSSRSSPISHMGDKQQQKSSSTKDTPGTPNGAGISLMRKLTVGGKRKPKSLPLLSVDNPVFEEVNTNRNKTSCAILEKSEKISDATAKSTKQPAPLVRERYRCIVPYPANSGYELELQVGDIVYVHKKREDGWLKGTLQRTGKTGLFPSIFVESC